MFHNRAVCLHHDIVVVFDYWPNIHEFQTGSFISFIEQSSCRFNVYVRKEPSTYAISVFVSGKVILVRDESYSFIITPLYISTNVYRNKTKSNSVTYVDKLKGI